MRRILPLLVLLTASAFAQVQPTAFGMHILHAVNGSTAWPTQIQFGAVRLWDSGTDWQILNPASGTYNWAPLDTWMSLAAQHDVDLLYTFGRAPSWVNGGKGETYPATNITDWDNFVTAIATRSAGRIKYWEIWNEANDTHFWYNENDLSTLVTMAQHAYKIIKSIDPNAVILTPSSTWTDTTPWGWMNSYLAAGGGQYADVIAVHGYVNQVPEEVLNSTLTHIKTVMSSNGVSSKPLWDTEASWSTGDSCTTYNFCDFNLQAGFLARSYALQFSAGVQRFYWYAWEDTWGTLWDPTNGPHPAAAAYQQVSKWFVGATFTQQCSADSNSTWTCPITRPGYQGLVVWNNTSGSYTAAPQYRQYRNLSGNTVAVPTNGVVTIGYQPILLETGTPGVNVPPTAVLTVTPQSGTAALTVTADSSTSSDSDGTIASRSINFGDGTIASSTTATHTYTSAGSYTVTLSVTDNSGATTSATKTVTVSAPAPAAPPACTSSLRVNMTSPIAGTTLGSPVHVIGTATSGCPIADMRIYVDGQRTYDVVSGTTNTYVTLTAGTHNVVLQAWDNTGAVTKVPALITVVSSCTLSTTNRTVTICAPLSANTVSSPVHVIAGTTDSRARVTAMKIYVDGQAMYLVNANKVDTSISIPLGTHKLTVQAWDASGAVFKTGYNINVQ